MQSIWQLLQPSQCRPITQQPAIDCFQTAQAVTEILITTVTIHQLRQLTWRDPPTEVDLCTRPHGSPSSPLLTPAQTTSHTHAAPGALAALFVATQTSPSPTTCCRSTIALRATLPAHPSAVPVPSLPHPEPTARQDAPPPGRCRRARQSTRVHGVLDPTPPVPARRGACQIPAHGSST